MKTLNFPFVMLIFLSLSLVNCGQPAENKTAQETAGDIAETRPGNIQDAMKQAEQTVKDLQGENANVTPVNFRKLKELLPDRLLGLPRTRHTGQSAGAMGMKFSTAEAGYSAGAKRLSVKIIDAGGIGAANLTMAAWSTLEIDKESDEGYEKTYKWGEFKAYESCRTSDGFCSLKLYNPKGIIAEIEGRDIPVADLKQVAEQIKLNSVPGMRE